MKKQTLLLIISILFTTFIHAQMKTSMNVKDLNSDIEKYISKTYKEFKTVEAYKYPSFFETSITNGTTTDVLVFDHDGKFIKKKTEADNAKTPMQTRTTIAVDDVESDITKYIKKYHEGYTLTVAYKFEEVYSTKIMKGAESETLLFDHEGKFIKKITASATEPHKKDSAAVKTEPKTDSVPPAPKHTEEPIKTDSVK